MPTGKCLSVMTI